MPLDLASVSAQLELNDIPESAHEPGPGHYFGPDSQGFNAMGKQLFSKCRSAPEVSLPRTGWENWQKVTVSKVCIHQLGARVAELCLPCSIHHGHSGSHR